MMGEKYLLTELQKRILDLYTKENKTQKEIAKIVYGRESCQSAVSDVIRRLSKKFGKNLTHKYGKNQKQALYEVDV